MAYKPVQMKIQDMFGGEVILRMAQQKAVSIQVQLAQLLLVQKYLLRYQGLPFYFILPLLNCLSTYMYFIQDYLCPVYIFPSSLANGFAPS